MIAKRKSQARVEGRAKGGLSGARPADRFQNAYRDYVQRIGKTFGDPELRDRPAKAHRDCVQALYEQQLSMDVQQQLAQTYNELMLAVRDQGQTTTIDRASSGVADAYSRFAKLLQDAMRDRQDRIAAAHRHYRDVLQQTPAQLKQHVEDAYRTYLRSLHAAWIELDPDSLDGSDLSEINQSTAQANAIHAAALNAVRMAGPYGQS
jgi:hypothetical protein